MNTAESITRTFSNAYEDLRDEAGDAARDARRDVTRFVRALPYAALGAASENLRRGRRATRWLLELPGRALESARQGPERIAEAYWDRAETGRDVFERVRHRGGVKGARRSARSATSAARSAATATRRAAKSAGRAASEATASLDPSDTRPYEERTVEELYALASEREIDGRSQMNKAELISALREKRA